MSGDYFFNAIFHLRTQEEAVLHNVLPAISNEEDIKVLDFLRSEFRRESLEFPGQEVEFNESAALWSARVIYVTMQLVLDRKDGVDTFESLYPAWKAPLTAEEMISADLCLRFIPDAIFQLERIDSTDPLISYLDTLLKSWNYSAIRRLDSIADVDFTIITEHSALMQMSIDRIIKFKKIVWANDARFISGVRGSLGLHIEQYWKEMNYRYESD